MFTHGWYQIAYEHELAGSLTPLQFGRLALMAHRSDSGDVRIFEATCPHRGANLAYGGTIDGDSIKCPFHGLRINLGAQPDTDLCVREYKALVCGGMVFVRLSDREEPSIESTLDQLTVDHDFITGPSLAMATVIEVVSENGWDPAHFKTVHSLPIQPKFKSWEGELGQLISEGTFVIPRTGWYETTQGSEPLVSVFRAEAFSPGLVIARLTGAPPFNYTIVTGATPQADESKCVVRITLVLPKSRPADESMTDSLMKLSIQGLEQDQVIWERLNLHAPSHLTPGPVDELFTTYSAYCRRFGEPTDRRLAAT